MGDISVLLQIGVTVVSAAAPSALLGWYLRGFINSTIDLQRVRNDLRHEQNLAEFRKVFIALTQLGWRNGG